MLSIRKNRFGIAYELCSNFVKKAVDRFDCMTLFKRDLEELAEDETKEVEVETVTIETIPAETTEFQLKFLNNIKEKRANMLSKNDLEFLTIANKDSFSLASTINELFNKIVKLGYSNYPVPEFNIGLEYFAHLNQMEAEIEKIFDIKFNNDYLKNYYTNYKIEARAFIEYCISKERVYDFNTVKSNLNNLIYKYIGYIQKNHSNFNYKRSYKLLNEFLA